MRSRGTGEASIVFLDEKHAPVLHLRSAARTAAAGVGQGQVEAEKKKEAEEEQSTWRCWQELHPPLLSLIHADLPSFADRLRMSAVCLWWRRELRSRPPPRPETPDLPLLVYHRKDQADTTHYVFTSDGASREIDVPGTLSMQAVGSAHGWIVYYAFFTARFFLLNPVTGSRIGFPPLPGAKIKFRPWWKAVISADPATTDPERLAVMFTVDNAIMCCRAAADSQWSSIETGAPYYLGKLLCPDMVASGGKVYVLTTDDRFGVVDVAGDSVDWLLIHEGGLRHMYRPHYDDPICRFLVEDEDEGILLVLLYTDASFDLYRADLKLKKWVRVPPRLRDNRLLFLRQCGSLCLRAPPGMEGGKAYVSYPGDGRMWKNRKFHHSSWEGDALIWAFTFSGSCWLLPSL